MHASWYFERRVYWLAYLGLLPLLAGSAWIALNPSSLHALEFFKNYAAVILTFVGAIHWGRAMYNQDTSLVTVSVLPSLFAFGCLLMPATMALPLLAGGFGLVLALDRHQYRHIPWFRQIRYQLSGMVITLLMLTWFLAR